MKHEIEDYLPSRSRNAISSLWFNFDCKQSNPDVFKDLPDRLKIGISLSTSSWRKIRGVWSSGGKEKHPEFPPSPSRWSNMAGFEHPNNWFLQRDGFYLCSQALWFPNNRDSQKNRSISGFGENLSNPETTRLDQKSLSFSVTDRPRPKVAILTSMDVEAQIFCLFHRLYQVNKACTKFHDSPTSFDCISWDSIWWVRSGYCVPSNPTLFVR